MGIVKFVCDSTIFVEEWIYRGEGNAHLALELPNSEQILRIKKNEQPKNGTMLQWIWQKLFVWNTNHNSLRDILFYKNVMIPFYGKFIDDIKHVTLMPEEIERLENDLLQYRPVNRKHKGLKINNAALFSDYAFLNSSICDVPGPHYAIEIKPKQGLPIAEQCMFCLKQEYKLLQGDISKVTDYCPLDLFSGNIFDMDKALKNLVDNPQNNLQIFKNGKLVYGKNVQICDFYDLLLEIFGKRNPKELLNNFTALVFDALLREFPSDEKHICKFNMEMNISSNCVLGKILSLQSCDLLRCPIYSKVEGSEYDYVDKYLEEIASNTDNCPKCVIYDYCSKREQILRTLYDNNVKEYSENCVDVILNDNILTGTNDSKYLLTRNFLDTLNEEDKLMFSILYNMARIASDCSLMITFKKLTEIPDKVPLEHIIKTEGYYFAFDVKVFDLYPKPQIIK